MKIQADEIQASHDTIGSDVIIRLSRGAMNALAGLLEDGVDLGEYSMNPGVMGVSDAQGEEYASVGYALLEALNRL